MAPHTTKWGIMATGGIAQTFTKDLLTNPATRGVNDVAHQLVAVASSTSKESAAAFVDRVKAPDPAAVRTYGSYAELVADADVDIIYISTPHSHHFQNAMLALEARKNVLCEKPFTVTATQTRKLVDAARRNGVFLMEAVWTRYFPLSIKIRDLVSSGALGTVSRVVADNSFGDELADGSGLLKYDDSHRMVNLNLAGGALLDLGIYSMTWVFQILYHLQTELDAQKESPRILAAMGKYHTGADDATSVIVQFPRHATTGIALTGLHVATDADDHFSSPSVRIQGSLGEIQVFGPPYRPVAYKLIKRDSAGKAETVQMPPPTDPDREGWGHGMYWEADECARCLRDGKKESATFPLAESVVIMEAMEEALRQGGIEYPQLITTDVYDANSPLNTGKR